MVLVHVEIPYGSNVKYEYEDNKLKVDRILSTSMCYPGNYGYIPKTLADDGDPIDVLIINSPQFYPTSYVDCKILGMLITEDEKGMDQKVIAIPNTNVSRDLTHINDITDINKNQLQLIKDFFLHYKKNEPDKWTQVYEYENAEVTNKFIIEKTLKNDELNLSV